MEISRISIGKSLSRNPYIFSLFMRMNLVEHVGSGIGRMKDLMLGEGLSDLEKQVLSKGYSL